MKTRKEIQEALGALCVEWGLDEVYGVMLNEHGKYRSVSFCRARTLDGEIRVYSPKFIYIHSSRQSVPHICKSFDEAVEYMKETYV